MPPSVFTKRFQPIKFSRLYPSVFYSYIALYGEYFFERVDFFESFLHNALFRGVRNHDYLRFAFLGRNLFYFFKANVVF